MNVLLVFYEITKNDRNTINEHLESFQRYSDNQIVYLNAFCGIPRSIFNLKFDVIVYHYTFLSQKWNGPETFANLLKKCSRLREIKGLKVAMPQDEYVYSDLVNGFFRNFGVDLVYTCLPKSEWQKVYPYKDSKVINFRQTLTGYVDDNAVARIRSKIKRHSARRIDIGYRARNLPYWLGRHGTHKGNLGSEFSALRDTTGLNIDISNSEKDVFVGEAWYDFLLNCRTVLGCEGGASLHDPDGTTREKVEKYVEKHPSACFDEVERSCFEGKDGNLKLFAISPRHFEACLTKTCQVLLEGEYNGIFKPGIHYIEIKKDRSNLEDVLKKIKDMEFCEGIAEKAYEDIVVNGRYFYSDFVKSFFYECERILGANEGKDLGTKERTSRNSKINGIAFRSEIFIRKKLATSWYQTKRIGYPYLKALGISNHYKTIKRLYSKRQVKEFLN